MPNWCYNYLNVDGTGGDIKRFVKETFELIKDTGEYSFSLELVSPTPLDNEGNLTEDWYEWRLSNWGTKWDVCETSAGLSCRDVESSSDAITVEDLDMIPDDSLQETSIYSNFETAWSPPLEAYMTMKNKYASTSLNFETVYHEPGVGFAGRYDFAGGEELNIEHYSVSFKDDRESYEKYYDFLLREYLETTDALVNIFDCYEVLSESERDGYIDKFYSVDDSVKGGVIYDYIRRTVNTQKEVNKNAELVL